MKIYSHRGNIAGENKIEENKFSYLLTSIKNGFNVEFDINFCKDKSLLLLSHDEAEYTEQYNIEKFFSEISHGSFHALNIKNINTIITIVDLIKKYKIEDDIFIFDFELLIKNVDEARFLMQSLTQKRINIAYRLSEREKYFEEYLKKDEVKILWLDEFESPWIKNHHIQQLIDNNKKSIYVSPELHDEKDMNVIMKRWEYMIDCGIWAICTDYPLELKKLIGDLYD